MDAKRISELRDLVSKPWVSIDPRWLTECLNDIELLEAQKAVLIEGGVSMMKELEIARKNYENADKMWQTEARAAMRERNYRD